MEKKLIGVDLGGTSIKMAILSETGEIQKKWEIHTNKKDNGIHIIKEISSSLKQKLNELHLDNEAFHGIGFGSPGTIDYENGTVNHAYNLNWKKPYPVKEELEKRTGLNVYLENDANVAALGERWKGAGQSRNDMVCVTLGTGIGGGIFAEGKIVHGICGSASEIGHITVMPKHGYECTCGNKGCLETVASALGIVRVACHASQKYQGKSKLKEAIQSKENISSKAIFDYANQNDKLARKVVNTISFYLALALSNIGNILNPEKIIIGGGVSAAGDALLKPVVYHFEKMVFPVVRNSTKISMAKLGNNAGVIGAASLSLPDKN